MFSPPKLMTILAVLTTTFVVTASHQAHAQNPDYQRRLAAMQQARGESSTNSPREMRVASAATGIDYEAPPAPTFSTNTASARSPQNGVRTAARTENTNSLRQPVGSGTTQVSAPQSNVVASRYSPAHLRTAQLHDGVIIDGGSPIVHDYSNQPGPIVGRPGYHAGPIVGRQTGSSGCGSCQNGCSSCQPGFGGSYGAVVESDCGCDGGCSSCGVSYFDAGDGCCGRGGCPPGDCWLGGLGGLLYNGEYFAGATGFQNALFEHPGFSNRLLRDSSFGFHTGMNFGIPLCKLTCGVLSGQFGVRNVQTNFRGGEFSDENRDQNFVTMGLYRRVDYGLQFGVVADVLHEDWFTETTTVQVRADLGWVFGGGSTFGFRYADNVQDDVQPGRIDGIDFADIRTFSEDWYRFYLRHDAAGGGYGEMFFGWTDASQTIFGIETDLPITRTISAQSSFTYFLDNEDIPSNFEFQGGNLGDAWNLAVGFAWHPRGRSYYKSYDRPLFQVADNGTMLMTRE